MTLPHVQTLRRMGVFPLLSGAAPFLKYLVPGGTR